MRKYAARAVAVFGVLLAALGVTALSAAASSFVPPDPRVVASAATDVVAGRLPHIEDPGSDQGPHGVVWTVDVIAVHRAAAGPTRPPVSDASLPVSTPPDVSRAGQWWTSAVGMVTIGLVGLLVVMVGGLAVAVGLGIIAGRRRSRGASADGTQPDSTGTTFK